VSNVLDPVLNILLLRRRALLRAYAGRSVLGTYVRGAIK